jgi:hypothetical protein
MIEVSNPPVFYDCEASCIGGLPIEIGWAFVDPSAGEIRSESHLVRPPSHWDLDPVWDPDAEKLHGISKEQLFATGRPPVEIARRMNEILAGRELFSDGPVDDDRWLRIIFGEAELQPAFTVQMVNANRLTAELASKLGWNEPGYESAKAEAVRRSPKTHRAEADARHLAVLWQIISDGPKHLTANNKESNIW